MTINDSPLTVEMAANDPQLDLGVRGILYAIQRGELPARKANPNRATSLYLIAPSDWDAFKQARRAAASKTPEPQPSKINKKRAQPSKG